MVNLNEIKLWLRRSDPAKLRYRVAGDDEWQPQELVGTPGSTRWKRTGEAILKTQATRVQALTQDGAVIDTLILVEEEEEAVAGGTANAARETAALALVVDAIGRRTAEAYNAGADAASRGQDNLVQVVNILTAQWSATMNSLHNVSQALARAIRATGGEAPEEGDDLQGPMQQMMGMAMMRMMGMGMPGGEAPKAPAPSANGAPKKEAK